MAYTFTDENAKEAIASGHAIVIDFWATWCAPCIRLTPIIEELAEEYADRVVIGKYNVDENTELGAEYRIMSIPTLLFFKNGEMVRDLRMAGAQSKDEIKARIEKLIDL